MKIAWYNRCSSSCVASEVFDVCTNEV